MTDSKLSLIGLGAIAGLGIGYLLAKRCIPDEKCLTNPTPEIMAEQFTRNIQFYGESGQKTIASAFVIIVGLGGVGSHAAVALARSGIGKIRLIDFDRVTLSSLNRHGTATWEDVGKSKVLCIEKRIKEFNPICEIEAIDEMFTEADADRLLNQSRPDYVIDAIDNVPTKIALLAYCRRNNIPVVTSCGSACKSDPGAVRVGVLGGVVEDELARAVRAGLRKKERQEDSTQSLDIPCVYSIEKSARKLLPLKEHQVKEPETFRTLTNFRVRILPVIAPMPAIFGNALAAIILGHLGGNEQIDESGESFKFTTKEKRRMLDGVRTRFKWNDAELMLKASHKENNVELIESIANRWKGKSAISGNREDAPLIVPWTFPKEAGPDSRHPRFDLDAIMTFDNLILVTREEGKRHLKQGGSLQANFTLYGSVKCDDITHKLKHP